MLWEKAFKSIWNLDSSVHFDWYWKIKMKCVVDVTQLWLCFISYACVHYIQKNLIRSQDNWKDVKLLRPRDSNIVVCEILLMWYEFQKAWHFLLLLLFQKIHLHLDTAAQNREIFVATFPSQKKSSHQSRLNVWYDVLLWCVRIPRRVIIIWVKCLTTSKNVQVYSLMEKQVIIGNRKNGKKFKPIWKQMIVYSTPKHTFRSQRWKEYPQKPC